MNHSVNIDPADAIEIAEALQWLRDWFASDPELASSMRRFSLGLISIDEIASDLDRFASRLGWQP